MKSISKKGNFCILILVFLNSCSSVKSSHDYVFIDKINNQAPYRILNIKDSSYSMFLALDGSLKKYEKVACGKVEIIKYHNRNALVFKDSVYFLPNMSYQANYIGSNSVNDTIEVTIMDSLLNPRFIELHLISGMDTMVLYDQKVYKTGHYTYKFVNQNFNTFFIKTPYPNSTNIDYVLVSNLIVLKNCSKIELTLNSKNNRFYQPKNNCMSNDTGLLSKKGLKFINGNWGEFKRK